MVLAVLAVVVLRFGLGGEDQVSDELRWIIAVVAAAGIYFIPTFLFNLGWVRGRAAGNSISGWPFPSLFPDVEDDGRMAVLGVQNNGSQDRFRVRVAELNGTKQTERPYHAPWRAAKEKRDEWLLLGDGEQDYVDIVAPNAISLQQPEAGRRLAAAGARRENILCFYSTTRPDEAFERSVSQDQDIEMRILVYREREDAPPISARFRLWFDEGNHMHFEEIEGRRKASSVGIEPQPGKAMVGSDDWEIWLDFDVINPDEDRPLQDVQVRIVDVVAEYMLDDEGKRDSKLQSLSDWSAVSARWEGNNDDPRVTLAPAGGTRTFRLAYARASANRGNLSFVGETRQMPGAKIRLLPDGPARVDLTIDSPDIAPVHRSFMVHFTRDPAVREGPDRWRIPPRGSERFEVARWEAWWAARKQHSTAT